MAYSTGSFLSDAYGTSSTASNLLAQIWGTWSGTTSATSNDYYWTTWQDYSTAQQNLRGTCTIDGRQYSQTIQVMESEIQDRGIHAIAQAQQELAADIQRQYMQYNTTTTALYANWAAEQQRIYVPIRPVRSSDLAVPRPILRPVKNASLAERNQIEINAWERDEKIKWLQWEKDQAEKVAQEMLLDIIGEDQFKVWQETGKVLVKGRRYDYLIQRKGFVQRIDKGKLIELGLKIPKAKNLCIALRDKHTYPETDNVIALAHHFKFNEDAALREANEMGNVNLKETIRAANF